MGWLQRLFGMEKPADAQTNPAPTEGNIDPERVGLNGEYDESGLAKRVALAFDEDPSLGDIETLWVAQTGGTVVLKGKVPSQNILNKAVSIAGGISGATSVDTDQVEVD
ncbi:BON domain-containing protein [Floridanema evergladense]|uniref:BON domain-containing protein n=1 Tax=Floridaenema evergladense BLCC-F167 TaxID=3153639 RepID=A0ABV4WRJ0_9CYAN